jgi:hypothetical protein
MLEFVACHRGDQATADGQRSGLPCPVCSITGWKALSVENGPSGCGRLEGGPPWPFMLVRGGGPVANQGYGPGGHRQSKKMDRRAPHILVLIHFHARGQRPSRAHSYCDCWAHYHSIDYIVGNSACGVVLTATPSGENGSIGMSRYDVVIDSCI